MKHGFEYFCDDIENVENYEKSFQKLVKESQDQIKANIYPKKQKERFQKLLKRETVKKDNK